MRLSLNTKKNISHKKLYIQRQQRTQECIYFCKLSSVTELRLR